MGGFFTGLSIDGYTVSVYRNVVIQSFADAATADLCDERNSKRLGGSRERCGTTVHRKLTMLDSAQRLEDLAAVPGNRFEALAGDRKGQHSIRVNQQYRSPSGGRAMMRTTSAARTTTESIPREASSLGPAIHPGEILLEEFLKPLEMTQAAAAQKLGMSTVRLNELVQGQTRGDRRHGAPPGAVIQDDTAVLDAHAGQLRPEGRDGASARIDAGKEAIGGSTTAPEALAGSADIGSAFWNLSTKAIRLAQSLLMFLSLRFRVATGCTLPPCGSTRARPQAGLASRSRSARRRRPGSSRSCSGCQAP